MKMETRRKITGIVCKSIIIVTVVLMMCIHDIELDMIWVPILMLALASGAGYVGHLVGAWDKDIWE